MYVYIYIYMQFSVEKRKDLNSNFTIRPLEKNTTVYEICVGRIMCLFLKLW